MIEMRGEGGVLEWCVPHKFEAMQYGRLVCEYIRTRVTKRSRT